MPLPLKHWYKSALPRHLVNLAASHPPSSGWLETQSRFRTQQIQSASGFRRMFAPSLVKALVGALLSTVAVGERLANRAEATQRRSDKKDCWMEFSIATLLSSFTDDKLVAPKVLEKKLGCQDEESLQKLQIALDALERVGILV